MVCSPWEERCSSRTIRAAAQDSDRVSRRNCEDGRETLPRLFGDWNPSLDIALVYLGDLAGQNSTAIANTLQAYFLPLGLAALTIVGILVYRELRTPKD